MKERHSTIPVAFSSVALAALFFFAWLGWKEWHQVRINQSVESFLASDPEVEQFREFAASNEHLTLDYSAPWLYHFSQELADEFTPESRTEASELLRKLLERNPFQARGWLLLGYLQLLDGERDLAELAVETGAVLDRSNPRLQIEAARLQLLLGNPDQAEQILDRLKRMRFDQRAVFARIIREELRWSLTRIFDLLELENVKPAEAEFVFGQLTKLRGEVAFRELWSRIPKEWWLVAGFADAAFREARAKDDMTLGMALYRYQRGQIQLPFVPLPESQLLAESSFTWNRDLNLELAEHPWRTPDFLGWRPPPVHSLIRPDWQPPLADTSGENPEENTPLRSGEIVFNLAGFHGPAWRWDMLEVAAPAGATIRLQFEYSVQNLEADFVPQLVLSEEGGQRDELRLQRSGGRDWIDAELVLPISVEGGWVTLQVVAQNKGQLRGRGAFRLRNFQLSLAEEIAPELKKNAPAL
jgi:hypothetical protein